jgi:putative tryptophan/tyrosine transport system substrate-binding protein
MKRRQFITLLGGAAAAWPLAARAQQAERLRRIGVLLDFAADDPEGQARLAALVQALGQLGWIVDQNMRIEPRWGATDVERVRKYAVELVGLTPDVIIAGGATSVRSLQQATDTVPIVFAGVTDPVGGGLVASLARPGSNSTGFINFEYSIGTKWLELLKQIAPGVKRTAVVRDPLGVGGGAQFGAIQGAASSFGVEVSPLDARDAAKLEAAITGFAQSSSGSLIVTSTRFAVINRDLIIAVAARHRLPAVYPYRHYITSGGLVCYGPDQIDQYRRAASYVDRILKGEKPADLPVQAPTKYELVINLKTAKSMGLNVPETLLARADEVIE